MKGEDYMIAYKLEKEIKLYRVQFDRFTEELFGDHRLDRYSLDLDGLLFRIKYMVKHKKDLDKLPEIKQKFINISMDMRKSFSSFMIDLLVNNITIPNRYEKNDIIDLFAHDVKIDPNYVTFKMIIISKTKPILDYIENRITNDVYNLYPNEYFRFYTDSYNDGIAKAYPELFENKYQNKVGVGDDADVFVHNFTFQTGEACSLNCTYCFAKGTRILMADGSYKNIEDIRLGDWVIGFDEDDYIDEPAEDFYPVKVTGLFLNTSCCFKISSKEIPNDIYVTPNHLIYTDIDEWTPVEKLDKSKGLMLYDNKNFRQIFNYSVKRKFTNEQDVYNIETTSGTYVVENLCVHNCYQFNKSPMRMTFETAKKFIDDLLDDKYGYINRYNSPAIIIEFIGGEPLLEINLTRQIYEYFLDRCYELNHPWFLLHRLSICSNGMQYFDPEVQSFFKEYSQMISFNISIDGNKELHDTCRVQPNGEGSYEVDMCALNHFNRHYAPERNSKMTLSPSNIKYLFDSVVDFIDQGMTVININCVFEEGWNQLTARIEYYQLKKLADYLLANNLENLYVAIFNERPEDKMDKEMDSNGCGGVGSMLALRPNGDFYPCLRYMPSSVGSNVEDLKIGNVNDGIEGREQGSPVLKMMDQITRRSQTTDICFNCPLSNDCPNCSALSHAIYGTPNRRTTFICIQTIAEALANVYYWNMMILTHPEYDLKVRRNVVPDEWALLVIDEEELETLKYIECAAIISVMEK